MYHSGLVILVRQGAFFSFVLFFMSLLIYITDTFIIFFVVNGVLWCLQYIHLWLSGFMCCVFVAMQTFDLFC